MTVDLQKFASTAASSAAFAKVQGSCNLVSSEGIYSSNLATAEALAARRAAGPIVLRPIVFLRRPASHLVSAWGHCKNSQGKGPLPNGRRYAEMSLASCKFGLGCVLQSTRGETSRIAPRSTALSASATGVGGVRWQRCASPRLLNHTRARTPPPAPLAGLAHHTSGNLVEGANGCGFNPRNFQVTSLGGGNCSRTVLIWQCDTALANCGLDRETGCRNRTTLRNTLERSIDEDAMLARALQVVRDAVSVGVLEHYPESVCLARAKIAQAEFETMGGRSAASDSSKHHRFDVSAIFSDCIEALTQKRTMKHTHEGVANASATKTQTRDRRTLSQLTEADEVLYGSVLRRFHSDLADIGHPMPWFQARLKDG